MANEIIKGMGFHHVALKVTDYERSIEFYKALGMKPIVEWGQGDGRVMMLDVGDGGRLEIFADGKLRDYPAEGKWQHFAFAVDNVEEAYNIALGAGAQPMAAPAVAMLEDARPSSVTFNYAFVLGPDGEQVEFFRQL